MKTIQITDFLTEGEIRRAVDMYKRHQSELNVSGESFNKKLVREIIEPNIERINKALGQENDPSYMAYVVEYVFMQPGILD